MPREVLLVAAYDSQLKWAMGIAAEFDARGWRCSVVTPSDIRSSLSDEQVTAAGGADVQRVPWDDLLRRARTVDCVVLAVQGTLVARFTDELELLRRAEPSHHEPVVVTGWVGIIIEKLVAGYLDRAGSDVIAVNSADNLREFTAAGRHLGVPPDNLLLSGLPLLPATPAPPADGPIRTIVFADQPTVPGSRWDRAYVYHRLLDHARTHPGQQVLLKPRHRPGEGTFHVMHDHPETIVAKLGRTPANFAITYDTIASLLPRTDLLLTVSSTAGLEAIGAGVRTVFVSDLGVHEKHGNQVLVPSGLLATFDDVAAGRIPIASPAWLADVFVGGGVSPVARIADRVEELVGVPAAQRPGRRVAAGPYLSGRVAVRSARALMPELARDPAAGGPPSATTRRALPVLLPLARRADLALRAFLPASWHRAARAGWYRLRVS
ncbi:MAG: hypothetical protein QM779_17145 [Propionicimonas sp.]|uniref:DUF6716 putative glycosyltransferase n=1 Tax=Propionicimonas sp. TaxID=1955623 RepID=UPI003D0E5D4C